MSTDACLLIPFPSFSMPEGTITPIEGLKAIPFRIARVFYLYDIPAEASRGGHAHRELAQVIICMLGSFEVNVDDGISRRTIVLRHADKGLLVPPMVWAELVNFSSGAICLTLASLPFDESDYLRDYEAFLALSHSLRSVAPERAER